MALKIIKPTDHVEIKNLIIVLFGQSGVGKTSLGLSANKSLLLDCDNGFQRAAFKGNCVRVRNWSDIASLTKEDMEPYDTIVIDTVGRLLEIMSVQLMNTKATLINKYTGGLALAGYGALSSMFKDFLAKIKSYEKDIVLLSHATEKQVKDEIVVRLDIPGSSKDEVRNIADLMGHVYMSGNSFTIDFNPSDTSPGKNFADLPKQNIPNLKDNKTFLGDLIELAKLKINAKSEIQVKAEQDFNNGVELINKASTLDEFNALINNNLIKDNNLLKIKLVEAATTKGFIINKAKRIFELISQESETEKAS